MVSGIGGSLKARANSAVAKAALAQALAQAQVQASANSARAQASAAVNSRVEVCDRRRTIAAMHHRLASATCPNS